MPESLLVILLNELGQTKGPLGAAVASPLVSLLAPAGRGFVGLRHRSWLLLRWPGSLGGL